MSCRRCGKLVEYTIHGSCPSCRKIEAHTDRVGISIFIILICAHAILFASSLYIQLWPRPTYGDFSDILRIGALYVIGGGIVFLIPSALNIRRARTKFRDMISGRGFKEQDLENLSKATLVIGTCKGVILFSAIPAAMMFQTTIVILLATTNSSSVDPLPGLVVGVVICIIGVTMIGLAWMKSSSKWRDIRSVIGYTPEIQEVLH